MLAEVTRCQVRTDILQCIEYLLIIHRELTYSEDVEGAWVLRREMERMLDEMFDLVEKEVRDEETTR